MDRKALVGRLRADAHPLKSGMTIRLTALNPRHFVAAEACLDVLAIVVRMR